MKTVATKASVSEFIAALEDPGRRKECKSLVKLMRRVTGKKPVMWGDSIVGFDVYIMPGYSNHSAILSRLGPHKIGKSCLYLKRLSDVDFAVLEELIVAGLEAMKRIYPR